MSQVPPGYKLLLQKPNGEIFCVLDLGGYDLTRFIAKASVIGEVSDALESELDNLDEGGESHGREAQGPGPDPG